MKLTLLWFLPWMWLSGPGSSPAPYIWGKLLLVYHPGSWEEQAGGSGASLATQ